MSSSLALESQTPFRPVFVIGEAVLALAGAAGAVQLATGVQTPPVEVLAPLGLSSWALPGAWLFGTVAVPSAAAAVLAWRRSPHAPTAVLVASGLLASELAVQVPFVGLSPLQPVFGAVAVGMGALALQARRAGWRPTG